MTEKTIFQLGNKFKTLNQDILFFKTLEQEVFRLFKINKDRYSKVSLSYNIGTNTNKIKDNKDLEEYVYIFETSPNEQKPIIDVIIIRQLVKKRSPKLKVN